MKIVYSMYRAGEVSVHQACLDRESLLNIYKAKRKIRFLFIRLLKYIHTDL